MFFSRLLLISATTLPLLAAATPSLAQVGNVCADHWYRRNAIFARAGYCFQTARARSVFGPGCFPPYGRLNRADQELVDAIKEQEAEDGCPP